MPCRQGVWVSLGLCRKPADWRNLALVVGSIGAALGVNWAIKKYQSVKRDRRREAARKELESDK
jgi:translocon-associated protein subunit beta